MVGEQVAYAVVGPDQLAGCTFETLADCLESWKETLPQRRAGGALIAYPWDLVERNGRQIALDFEQGPRRQPSPDAAPFAVVGPRDQLLVDPTATVEPMVVVDTRGGPVVIEREAVVTAFTRLEGPCYVGPQTHVLGARVRAGTTLGPCCRVGGEVEASILHGYSNKYHDGFLGHSYVGEWVNLGAGTNNSDLRNDYGEVTVLIAGRPVATGQTKVGCFLGDHTKSGLGTLLNTGSNVGAFCNLLPSGAFVSKYLPPFTSWWNGGLRENSDLERLLATAAKVMQRRGCTLTEGHAVVYRSLFEQTAAERKRALREAEQRRFRASA
jgi:UDP-N-acetylglucosamine diphosphorylase/glucosamine-1-phosphate N-acetyltransferase